MKSLEKHGDIIFGLLACACSLFVLTMPYLDPLNISGFPALDWMAAPILWVFFCLVPLVVEIDPIPIFGGFGFQRRLHSLIG